MHMLLAVLLASSQAVPNTWHWVRATSADIELAVPAEFKQVETKRFGKTDAWNDQSLPAGQLRRFVSVKVEEREEPWTLKMSEPNFDCADCSTVFEVQESTSKLDGMSFRIQVARVSGSFFHLDNAAKVRAYHQLDKGKWLVIEALAPSWADRGDLLTIVRSIRKARSR